jgi:hypothetical protein
MKEERNSKGVTALPSAPPLLLPFYLLKDPVFSYHGFSSFTGKRKSAFGISCSFCLNSHSSVAIASPCELLLCWTGERRPGMEDHTCQRS